MGTSAAADELSQGKDNLLSVHFRHLHDPLHIADLVKKKNSFCPLRGAVYLREFVSSNMAQLGRQRWGELRTIPASGTSTIRSETWVTNQCNRGFPNLGVPSWGPSHKGNPTIWGLFLESPFFIISQQVWCFRVRDFRGLWAWSSFLRMVEFSACKLPRAPGTLSLAPL